MIVLAILLTQPLRYAFLAAFRTRSISPPGFIGPCIGSPAIAAGSDQSIMS